MARLALEYPLPFRILRRLFPLLQNAAPKMALHIATKLFLTPIRFDMNKAQRSFLKEFEQSSLEVSGRQLMVYKRGKGPKVLCLHGWSGRAMQFASMSDHLVNAGFSVIAIDAPGHGESEGGATNLFEFVEAFQKLIESESPIHAVLGHSLGAAAISLAISDGLQVPAFGIFGAPVVAQDILDEFARRINAKPTIFAGIREKAVAKFGRTFDEVAMESTFGKVTCPAIAFHGDQDLDVPLYHMDVLQAINPSLETHTMPGIGHRRILKDERVMEVLINWLKNL
jgi:pimeloyl-ACP methyl ester carboxylesterase